MILQQKAYSQLSGNEDIPEKYKRSADSQLNEMKKIAKGKVVLMILDDVVLYTQCAFFLYHFRCIT